MSAMSTLVIGVLELQGAFAEHTSMLSRCVLPPAFRVKLVGIRGPDDLKQSMDGIVLPGGESTVQGKLLVDLGMMGAIRKLITEDNVPVFGTCAGAILLSNHIIDDNVKSRKQSGIGGLNVRIARNAYGRQIDSHETHAEFAGSENKLRVVQIRAPMFTEITGGDVRILASVGSGDENRAVLVEEGNILAATFHPELTHDCRVHEHFLNMVMKHKKGEKDSC